MGRLCTAPIDLAALIAAVHTPADGALALFLGTVRAENAGRRVRWLEYVAYAELAEAELARIEREAQERYAITRAGTVHRTGRLELGETSVAVAVAAPHRADALEACRFVIDALKRSVPIWKKEVFEGGEAWVEGGG
ncbi:MAG TPA: molybdenum cofactor biosynthesis protein MoaE [Candidatus Polarisedimenticolaceae bacterium]|nr:molybdenum cofactor biosynthesis protein MoaE [Candidatus Polarisedimenticolaceae bacterium]